MGGNIFFLKKKCLFIMPKLTANHTIKELHKLIMMHHYVSIRIQTLSRNHFLSVSETKNFKVRIVVFFTTFFLKFIG